VDHADAADRGPAVYGAARRVAAARVAAEWLLHALAAALLIWGLLQSVRRAPPVRSDSADAGTLHAALVRWSTVAAPTSVHVELDSVPTPADRDWLTALPGAGTQVGWDSRALRPLALAISPVPDPAGVVRLRVAAPRGTAIVLRDAVGVLDTVSVRPGGSAAGVSITVPGALAAVSAAAGHTTARAVATDSLVLGHLLVLGRVGWESRFIVDALEERGWRVDARLALAPKTDVVQGVVGAIDTGRYAAVVVADSSAAGDATRLATYVRSGGGLVLAGSAAEMRAIRELTPGAVGALIPPGTIGSTDSTAGATKHHLGLVPIVDLHADAVPLESRDTVVAVAARRVGAGRIVQTGYVDTWRWRMSAARGGGDHREWWAGLVSAVAYAPAVARAPDRTSDNAPVARLIDALGPMTAQSPGPRPVDDRSRRGWLFAAIVVALLAEWGSRRFRGGR
jgi:hypothetical protein